MGRNKALMRLRQGGPTLIETVVASLRDAGMGDGLLLVANTQEEYAFLELPIVPDEIPGVGPSGGILTALLHSPYERVLVVACDMPRLNPALLDYMAHLPDHADILIPRWTNHGGTTRVETLHAIYSHRCIEPIRSRLSAGQLSVHGLLSGTSVRYFEEEELRVLDPDLDSFQNINTPADVNYEF
jgi:molybdopterin-guanine dinucleotide biosynthesis protein A